MSIRQLVTEQQLQDYDEWVSHHPEGNFWQSLDRKKYVEALGKKARIYELRDGNNCIATAQVVIDTTAFGLTTWEIPRGPIGERREELLDYIVNEATQENCMALYFSPPSPLSSILYPLSTSSRHIHCEATRILDLTQSEQAILAQMKPKGRYNIRLAQKHGISAELSDDLDGFLKLIDKTAKRDRFGALPPSKYRSFYENIEDSFLIMTYHPDKPAVPLAGLLGVLWNKQAIYYYGASDHDYRALMAPYRVQWKAMRHAKELGAKTYDLLGIAPNNSGPKHPWHGISEFKEKFGGTVVTYPPEHMVVLKPWAERALRWKRGLLG